MASVTSGQLNTDTTWESYFWVRWSQNGSQDNANNRTPINWSCGVYCGHSFYNNAIKMSAVYINNTPVYGGGTYSNYSKGDHTIASGTMWIDHNSDGKKTFSISSFTGWLYSNYNYSSNGGSFELTQIPRQATLVDATDFTDLKSPTVTYSNPAGESVSTLQAYIYDTDDRTILVDGKDLPKDGTSKALSLTNEEIDILRYATTGYNKKVWFYIKTIIGGLTYWSSRVEKTFSVEETENTKPVVRMAVELNNDSLPSKFDGLYIQGKSRLDVSLSAEGRYEATITSLWAEMNGKSYTSIPFTSDVVQSSGNVVGYAKDSRGFTGLAEQQIVVVPYSKPWIVPIHSENSILCYRSDGNGNRIGNSTSVWIKAKRGYYSLSGKNTCALQWRMKPSTEGWNDSLHKWNYLLTNDAATDEYNAMLSGIEFEKTKSYTVQIMAIDDIGEYDIKTFDIPTQDVALHLGKGGKNVSVGSYCDYSEEHTFRSEWKAIFNNGVQIGEYLIADYPVEIGTDGTWNYRKWASGIAECWGVFDKTPTDSIPWVSLHYHKFDSIAFPFTFTEIPTISFNLDDSNCWGIKSGTTTSDTGVLYAISPAKISTSVTCKLNIMAKGRWKNSEEEI